jgi:hypothetical protein
MAIAALGIGSMLGGDCDPKGPDFYEQINGGTQLTGDIFGTLRLDNVLEPGATVTVRMNQTVVGTDVTDSNGAYRVPGLNPGTYLVDGSVTGADCGDAQTAVVAANGETEVNILCETPAPQTGTVTGTVTVNSVPEPNVTVRLRDGTTVIATTTTGSNGTYSFTNQATGSRIVEIVPPSGATCPDPQTVNVTGGGTATANFPCTRPSGDFIVVFTQIVTDHRGQTSVICWVTTTTPAQPGATLQVVTTGPGVLTPTVNRTLNAGGMAAVEVGINLFGTYGIMQTATSGSNQASASTTHTVDLTESTCADVMSSIRFKRGVLSLLPDDVRPLGLRPVAFRYVEPWGDPAEPRIGLVAEEVLEVFPTAVFLDAVGRPESIHYGLLTKAVVDELEARAAGAAKAAIARLAEAF